MLHRKPAPAGEPAGVYFEWLRFGLLTKTSRRLASPLYESRTDGSLALLAIYNCAATASMNSPVVRYF